MEVLSIARTGGQRRTGVCHHSDPFAAFATLPTSGNRASGHRPGTSGQCSSRERARPFSTTPASSASLKPPPTSVCRCPSTRPRRPEGSSMSAYRGFDEVTGLLLSTGGMGMALLGRPGDSAPDPRRDAGLGRDARPLRRPCRSAQHRCAPHPQRGFLDYITGNLAVTAGGLRSPRTLSAAVDVLGPADPLQLPHRRRPRAAGSRRCRLPRHVRRAGRRPRLRRPCPARRAGPGQARQPQRRTSPGPLPPERQTHA